MTLHPASRTGTGQGRRRLWTLGRPLLLLLLAVVLSLVLLLPWAHWTLEPRMVQYIVAWLLRPSTGFLSLTLVVWLLFTAPRALRFLGGALRSEEESAPEAREETVADPATPVSMIADRADGERLRIPAVTFRELDAGHRRELARALGIPWRDELIHDHQSWVVACLEAAQDRAAAVRR